MPFYTSRGARLHYEIAGEGPPVLLVHGFTNFGQVWAGQIATLVHAGYLAIVPDLAGHGLSAGADTVTDMPMLAGDMVALLDALGLDRATVCGLSLGGMVAQQMMVDHPERVTAAVIAGSRADNSGMAAAVANWITEFEGPGGALGRLAKTYPMLLNESYRNSAAGEATLQLWQLVLSKVDGHALAQVARGLLRFDVGARLPSVRTPTLMIAGEEDRLIAPALTRRIAELIPDAQFAAIAGGGHISSLDSTATFNTLLLQFLAEA